MRYLVQIGVLALSLFAVPALADVRHDPIKIRLLGPPRAVETGKAYAGTLQVLSAKPVTISNLRLEGLGWNGRFARTASTFGLKQQQPMMLRFEATSSVADANLIVRFDVDGAPYERVLDLSRASVDRVTQAGALERVESKGAPPFRPIDTAQTRPQGVAETDGVYLRRKADRQMNDAAEPEAVTARDIRVYGRFVYRRSDGQWIGADGATVRIYDEDTGFDEHLATDATDAYGNYDITFRWDPCWLCDGQPDIYVEFESANTEVEVEDATWEINYKWETGTTNDYTGTSLNKGTVAPSSEGDHPALHILTNITRDWRWYLNREGYNLPSTDVQWPDGSTGAWYNDYWEEIHISSGRQWREDTHAHEYGHHFIYNYAVGQAPDYCNGICDNGDCGHCLWCRETNHDAWNEGWPNWIAHVQTSSYASSYGIASMNTRDMEDVAMCTTTYHDPTITEGFMSALLQDIWDSSNEDDPGAAGSWRDRLSMGTNEIFDVVDFDHPLNPLDFIQKFKTRYPWLKEDLWETAKNCRYEVDAIAPTVVSGLTSTSHSTSGDSPDPTIDFTWTRATDDFSGVSGYSIVVANSLTSPDLVEDIGDVTTHTTSTLTPGTYYFSIRTRDRSGKWSSGYSWRGPYTIRAPEPANLVFETWAGWARPVVPRGAPDATPSSVPFPSTLPGNVNSTYWNMAGRNVGESPTSGGSQARLYVDGSWQVGAIWGSIGANGGFYAPNWGPTTVRGGRHVYASRLDALDEIAETNENDNEYGRQWIWTSYDLTPGTAITRASPPDRTGGWDMMTEGAAWYNVDGLQFNASGWWNAVWVHATNDADDYDCRLHFATANADTGFAGNKGWSSYIEGYLDAVIVNGNTAGRFADWDVGVINFGGTSNYKAKHVTSSALTFGDSLEVTIPAGEMMILREFYVATEQTGPVSMTARIVQGDGPVEMRWFGSTFATGDLTDADDLVTVNASSLARIDTDIATTGWNGIALSRNPKDGTSGSAVTVVLEISTTPPDFIPYAAAGWHSPFVPRSAFDGTPGSVPLPDTLHGNVASTYLNFAVRNDSPTGSAGLGAHAYLDGVYSWWLSYSYFPGYANSLFNWDYASHVRGGRHTLSVFYDHTDAIEEMYEDNNICGEQFNWSPYSLALDVPVTRSAPPDRSGGWEHINSGEAIWYNCDGLRTPAFSPSRRNGYWGAVAIMPGATSDVDVRFHEQLTGTKSGFSTNYGVSSWGVGQSDYVLANFNLMGFRGLDAGALRWGGTQTYTAQAVSSTYEGTAPQNGTVGPFTLGSGRILRLHEFYMPAGTWQIWLENRSGTVDWGITLHPATEEFLTKSTALPNGSDWFAPAGESELLTVSVPAAGYYCLAVWKVGTLDLNKSGDYRLLMTNLLVSVDAPPARTMFSSVYPNPFVPSTTIMFELAREQPAGLEVYDLQGARVRTLVRGTMPAGRHQIIWNGTDDAGRRLSPGVYVVRFASGDLRAIRKVVKLR